MNFFKCLLVLMLLSQNGFVFGDDAAAEYEEKYEEKADVNTMKETFERILKDPEYLSLEPMERLKILIVFYHILENPNQNWYGNLIEMLNEKSNQQKLNQQ